MVPFSLLSPFHFKQQQKKSIQQNHIHTQKKNTPDQSSTSKTQRKRHPSELSKKKRHTKNFGTSKYQSTKKNFIVLA